VCTGVSKRSSFFACQCSKRYPAYVFAIELVSYVGKNPTPQRNLKVELYKCEKEAITLGMKFL